MVDYNLLWGALQNSANQTGRSMPWLGVPAIMSKPIVEAGLSGLGWGAGATKAAAAGHQVDPATSLYNMVNIYGLGGPAGGLTSGGMKAAPWFSAVGRAIESSPLKSASGQQWLGTIKNAPGIKQEELDWTKVPEWLGGQQAPVIKSQLQDYLKANQVDVQEVVKGQPTPMSDKVLTLSAKRWYERTVAPGKKFEDLPAAEQEGWRAYIRQTEIKDLTKFSQYQMPGGENYRELLLTLPEGNPEAYAFNIRNRSGNVVARAMNEDEAARMGYGNRDVYSYDKPLERPGGFRGGHYDEPNILAHVRFNDRVDASGKKTLFIEEIQSDWHQKGRKRGYQGSEKDVQDLPQGTKVYPPDDANPYTRSAFAVELPQSVRGRQLFYGRTQSEAEANARDFIAGRGEASGAVPDAPFKTSWPELSLKRMIKWAADHGYDQIAWTPGKVQAERYDLSKQIKTLKVERIGGHGEPQYVIQAQQHGDRPQANLGAHEAKDLAEVVGKEMAEKIANNKDKVQIYEGLDLQVGGEGMKAFYDKMLVNTANKLGKKFGAKVGVTKLGSDMKPGGEHYKAFMDELGMSSEQWAALSRDERNKIVAERKGHEVWSLPITDAMKKEVTEKGMPLFSGGKGGSLASILQQALTGDNGDEPLGSVLSKALGDKSR